MENKIHNHKFGFNINWAINKLALFNFISCYEDEKYSNDEKYNKSF